MKPVRCLIVVICLALLSGCENIPFLQPTATPTKIPTPTAIPPTPTPAPGEILSSGWQAYDAGDYVTAREIAEQVKEQFPENGEAYALLGAVDADQGDLVMAIARLEISQEYGYEDSNSVQLLSHCYLERISQIIEAMYNSWDYEEIRDLIYLAREYLEEEKALGLETSQRAAALDAWFNQPKKEIPNPLHEEGPAFDYWQKAKEYEEAGNIRTAIAQAQNALAESPESPYLHDYIAFLYLEQDDYETAFEHLQTAIEIDPEMYELWTDLGLVYSLMFLPFNARQALITSMLSNPDYDRNEDTFDILTETFGAWDVSYFLDYGFRLSVPPEGEFCQIPELVDATPIEGAACFSNPITLLNLIWMPLSESAYSANFNPKIVVSNIPLTFSIIGDTSPIGDPLVFPHNQVEITYQPYLMTPTDKQITPTIGIYSVWQCNETLYILNQFISDDNPDNLFLFNPFLESVTCDLESIIPEHP